MYAILNSATGLFFAGFDENNKPIWDKKTHEKMGNKYVMLKLLNQVLQQSEEADRHNIVIAELKERHPRYFLALRFVFPDRTETRYYVGKEEGYSVMESLAYKFEDHELGVLIHIIHEFYKNTERYLADAPSNCRSVTAYPIKINEDYHVD